jgi:hypothetical protein
MANKIELWMLPKILRALRTDDFAFDKKFFM